MKISLSTIAAAASALFATTQAAAGLSYNGLAITPQMGWDNWNSFGCSVSEELLLGTAERIVNYGLRDLGYRYVILDDCWSAGRNSSGFLEPNTTRFPNGMAHVADQLHGMGLLYGMYSSAGEFTCAGYAGSLDYEPKDANTFAQWGVDYLKYDNCYNMGRSGDPLISFNRYKVMSDALNATGRPILYSLCNWGDDKPWEWGSSIANSWRTTGDITDHFDRPDARCPCTGDEYYCQVPGFHCSIMNILNKNSAIPSKAQEGGWNDLDMLEVGNGGMSDDEYVLHMSMWALMKSPLIMGNRLNSISAQDLSILMNPAVIAINQDPQGSSGYRVWRFPAKTDEYGMGEIALWVGGLNNGDQAVALLNAGNTTRTMGASLADIFSDAGGAHSTQYNQAWDIYDLWGNRMSNETAQSIIDGTAGGGNATTGDMETATNSSMASMGWLANVPGYYNASQMSYRDGLAANNSLLFGRMIGTVQPQGTLTAEVPRHGIAFYRLRLNAAASLRKRDEL